MGEKSGTAEKSAVSPAKAKAAKAARKPARKTAAEAAQAPRVDAPAGTVAVVNADNQRITDLVLHPEVFAVPVNQHLLYEAVKQYRAGARAGTHQTKNRANVSGSGKKPWRQKGTGRARVGSVRTPLWRHGGTVFGPRPRSYGYSLSKKAELGALRAALSAKLQAGELVVVDALTAAEIKTKAAVELLARLGVTGKAVLVDV